MESVQLVQRHLVQHSLNLVLVEEVPHHVQHHSPPGEARLVLDIEARNRPLHTLCGAQGEHLRRQQLQQRLHPVKHPRHPRRPDHHRIWRDRQFVSFRAQAGQGVCCGQHDRPFDRGNPRIGPHLELVARGLEQHRRQVLARRLRSAVHENLREGLRRRTRDRSSGAEGKHAGPALHLLRQGNNGRSAACADPREQGKSNAKANAFHSLLRTAFAAVTSLAASFGVPIVIRK